MNQSIINRLHHAKTFKHYVVTEKFKNSLHYSILLIISKILSNEHYILLILSYRLGVTLDKWGGKTNIKCVYELQSLYSRLLMWYQFVKLLLKQL